MELNKDNLSTLSPEVLKQALSDLKHDVSAEQFDSVSAPERILTSLEDTSIHHATRRSVRGTLERLLDEAQASDSTSGNPEGDGVTTPEVKKEDEQTPPSDPPVENEEVTTPPVVDESQPEIDVEIDSQEEVIEEPKFSIFRTTSGQTINMGGFIIAPETGPIQHGTPEYLQYRTFLGTYLKEEVQE